MNRKPNNVTSKVVLAVQPEAIKQTTSTLKHVPSQEIKIKFPATKSKLGRKFPTLLDQMKRTSIAGKSRTPLPKRTYDEVKRKKKKEKKQTWNATSL